MVRRRSLAKPCSLAWPLRSGTTDRRAAVALAHTAIHSGITASTAQLWTSIKRDNPDPRTIAVTRDGLRATFTPSAVAACGALATGLLRTTRLLRENPSGPVVDPGHELTTPMRSPVVGPAPPGECGDCPKGPVAVTVIAIPHISEVVAATSGTR